MCGIAGIYNYQQATPIPLSTILGMCESMRSRGPDGIGHVLSDDNGLGLGHTRLCIIDVEGGAQPISNENDVITTVFNGEIYNYRELRESLRRLGHRFETHTDTEVLVHLYEEEDKRLVEKLNGDFAFAVWDDERKRLLLARDRLGVKPLYYSDHNGQLAFASTLPALLRGSEAPRELDMAAMHCYLTFGCIQSPLSIYRHIRKLPPGHLLIVQNGKVTVQPYWDVPMEPDHTRSADSFAEEIDSLIVDAIKRQMVADVPLGAFLSGGVDSSAIVSVMAQVSNQPIKTFSMGFEDRRYDESRYYRMLSEELGVEHHEMVFQPQLLEDVGSIVDSFGEPCSIASAFPLFNLSKMARGHVTVVLSGDGPDEIFAGYDLRYRYIQQMVRAQKSTPALLLRAFRSMLAPTQRLRTTSKTGNTLRRARKFLETVGLPREQWHPFLMMNRTALTGAGSLLHGDPLSDGEGSLPYVEAFRRQPANSDWLGNFVYADIKVNLPSEMFVKLDCMTMAHSLEGRVPLCDYRLVELAGRIPSDMKFRQGRGKVVFRDAVRHRLPNAIMDRPKVGFRVPLNEWFRDELYPMACDLLTDTSFRESGVFQEETVAHVLQEHHARRQNFGSLIWALVVFELWRRSVPSPSTA